MGSAPPSPLRRVLRATEYFTLAFGCIIGVGWLVVISLALAVVAAWGLAWYLWLVVAGWLGLGLLLWSRRRAFTSTP
jgi:hypothetical protein